MTETQPSGPVEAAQTFVEGVAWGQHDTVWDMLSQEARQTVLRVAVNQGMDEALAARLRDDTATASELNEFLLELVKGLRADLHGHDLDALVYELEAEPSEVGRANVVLITPVPPALGEGLPAGSVELSQENGQWRVDRLVPRRSLSG